MELDVGVIMQKKYSKKLVINGLSFFHWIWQDIRATGAYEEIHHPKGVLFEGGGSLIGLLRYLNEFIVKFIPDKPITIIV